MHLEIEFQVPFLFRGERRIDLFNGFPRVVYALRFIEGLPYVLRQVAAVEYFLKISRRTEHLVEDWFTFSEKIRIAILGNQKRRRTAASPEKQGGAHYEEYRCPDLTRSKL